MEPLRLPLLTGRPTDTERTWTLARRSPGQILARLDWIDMKIVTNGSAKIRRASGGRSPYHPSQTHLIWPLMLLAGSRE